MDFLHTSGDPVPWSPTPSGVTDLPLAPVSTLAGLSSGWGHLRKISSSFPLAPSVELRSNFLRLQLFHKGSAPHAQDFPYSLIPTPRPR